MIFKSIDVKLITLHIEKINHIFGLKLKFKFGFSFLNSSKGYIVIQDIQFEERNLILYCKRKKKEEEKFIRDVTHLLLEDSLKSC